MGKTLGKILNSNIRMDDLLDLVHLRNLIRSFKKETCEIVKKFHVGAGTDNIDHDRFIPAIPDKENEVHDRRNIGIYSTACCLQSLAKYKKELPPVDTEEKKEEEYNKCRKYFTFIIKGIGNKSLSNGQEQISNHLGIISKINTLCRFCSYIKTVAIKDEITDAIDEINFKKSDVRELEKILLDLCIEFQDMVCKDIKNSHPYIYFRFIKFLKLWGEYIKKKLFKLDLQVFMIPVEWRW